MTMTKCARVMAPLAVVAACMVGMSGTGYAVGLCPTGYGFDIKDGTRLHRDPNLNSPVDGIFYTGHDFQVDQMIGMHLGLPAWVKINDFTTGVIGFAHGSVATCIGLTSPH